MGEQKVELVGVLALGGCRSCQVMADMAPDFASARRALEKKTPERRDELLRLLDWTTPEGRTTLKGRGGRARRLRGAPLDLGNGHPFASPSHRPPLAIPGRTTLTFIVGVHHFFKHLRELPRAERQAHLEGAPDWMRTAYENARAALNADNTRWKGALARATWKLVGVQLGLDERTVRSHERAAWDWATRLKQSGPTD